MSKFSITTVQTDIIWRDRQANLTSLTKVLSKITSADLILLPETFATGFTFHHDAIESIDKSIILSWMKAQAACHQAVIAGTILVKNQDKLANRFYWVWPNGDVKFYDKRHLFRQGDEHHYVIAGNQRKIIEISGVRILPSVCYDLRFPVWSRNRNDYDILINVANWPAKRSRIWHTLLQARAIENQVFTIGVNRIGCDGNGLSHCGGTVIYDFIGQAVYQAQDNQPEIHNCHIDLAELQAYKESFPTFLDADNFILTD